MECVRGGPSKQQSERLLGPTYLGTGAAIGAGLSLGSLAPATTGTSSPQATAQVRMSKPRPAVLLCLLTISPAQPPSNLFVAKMTATKHSLPDVLWIQLPNF